MISSTRSNRLAVLAAVASLAFAACSGAASTAPTSPPSVPPSVAPTTEVTPSRAPCRHRRSPSITIGVSVTEVSQYAAVLAKQLGLYEKYGLNVEMPTVFEGDGKA